MVGWGGGKGGGIENCRRNVGTDAKCIKRGIFLFENDRKSV